MGRTLCIWLLLHLTDDYSAGIHTFNFTSLSGRSCRAVPLPLSAVRDPFTDTVFSAAVVHQGQPPFDLGPLRNASLVVEALKGMETN